MPNTLPLPQSGACRPSRALKSATPRAPTPRCLCTALAMALAGTLPVAPAMAAELTWTGLLGTPAWSARFLGSSNWAGGAVPHDGDRLVFDGSTGLANSNDYSNLLVSGLSFAAGAGAFTIGGLLPSVETRLALTGNIVNLSSQLQTINLGIEVRSSQVWDGGSGGLVVSGGLLLAGNASLSLSNGAQANLTNALTVGRSGGSSLHVDATSQVRSQGGVIGEGPGSSGSVSLEGAGSSWSAGNDSVVVGGLGRGTLSMNGGARLSSGTGVIGQDSGGNGSVSVSGIGTQWTLADNLRVGQGGSGALTVAQGGLVSSVNAQIGPRDGRAQGLVRVTGAGSRWLNSGTLVIGSGLGSSLLQLEGGGFVSSRDTYLGDVLAGGSVGSAVVQGAGSVWVVTGALSVGNAHGGTLTVDNAGRLNSASAQIGGEYLRLGAVGVVTVQGAGSRWVNSGNLAIGNLGAGTLTVATGGTTEVGGALRVGDGGVLNLQGGTLQIHDAALQGTGQFNWTAGTLLFTNPGATLGAGLFQLGSTTSVGTQQVLAFAQSFAVGSGNLLQLAGGTLAGPGSLLNDGLLTGFGALAGSSGFSNSGVLVQAGGNLVLSNTGPNTNTGSWDLAPGKQLQLAGNVLTNHGSLNLNGATVTGTGMLVNAADGVITGRGGIAAGLRNAGVLALESGITTVGQGFANSGQVQLSSNTAALAGGLVSNSGFIEGRGRVANAIDNTGRLEALVGTLTLAGALTHAGSGVIAAGAGTQVVVLQGLARNEAAIQLAGGTFDNNGAALVNDRLGTISGHGTLRSGLLVNDGQILLAGGTTTLHGDLRATGGSRLVVSGDSQAVFQGAVEIRDGAELRVAQGSSATFFGVVNQRNGAVLTGMGSKFFEGGLAMGNSPGLGLDAGSVAFGAHNLYTAEVAGTSPGDALGNGIQFDRYGVAGELSFGGTLKLVLLDGFAPQAGQRFDLFDWGSTQGQFVNLNFAQAPLAAGLGWDTSRLYVDGSLQVAAVPEPAPAALLLAGLGAVRLLARRRSGQGATRPATMPTPKTLQ